MKHEYLDGQILAMAGGTLEHAALAASVIGLLFPQLRDGRGRAHDADLRVRVRATRSGRVAAATLQDGRVEEAACLDAEDPLAAVLAAFVTQVDEPVPLASHPEHHCFAYLGDANAAAARAGTAARCAETGLPTRGRASPR